MLSILKEINFNHEKIKYSGFTSREKEFKKVPGNQQLPETHRKDLLFSIHDHL